MLIRSRKGTLTHNDTQIYVVFFLNLKIKLKNMNTDNKSTELDNTDKKLHISDVSCSSISRDDINKQAYLVMSNINATKIMTNISDSNHETLMNSFFTLQGMFNEYLKQNGVE